MDNILKEQLVTAMLRLKKETMPFSTGHHHHFHMGEIAILKGIEEKASCPDTNVYVSDIQSKLHITKSAVSQMLNALEKKGLINREIDQSDRRKIAVTLTPRGQKIFKHRRDHLTRILDEYISRLGEENTRELIRLVNLMADITEDMIHEETLPENK